MARASMATRGFVQPLQASERPREEARPKAAEVHQLHPAMALPKATELHLAAAGVGQDEPIHPSLKAALQQHQPRAFQRREVVELDL